MIAAVVTHATHPLHADLHIVAVVVNRSRQPFVLLKALAATSIQMHL